MLFKTPSIGPQYASLHPALRRALKALDGQVVAWGLPELTITEAVRTKAEQVAIYTAVGVGKGLTEEAAREAAEKSFSYHLCSCAADFRSSGQSYSEGDWSRIRGWMRERHQKPMWEALVHSVGLGMHGHLAVVDFVWRRQWEQQTRSGRGVA